ncbi:discoidin domain-containing protein [Planosporangium sp. 12N6]|uniref:galactose-binding domain-containing protein n=1 Tax=Planosporangium spinosum TaxID=3402278 RepID=UPI003CEFC37B
MARLRATGTRWRRAATGAVVAAVATLVAMAGAVPAHADVVNPRQTWLRNATGGLFLHWGMRTSPGYTSCTAWENAVTSGGWSADYWVREAQKLHTQYIVLATMHSRLGYARPYPSKIPGSCATRRDFLGELIAAAKAKGLKVVYYQTDDPQWHDEGGHEWLDSAAYSTYAGHTVDLTTRPGFGEFSYKLFFEMMSRYPDLAGFWIDNDNAYWEDHNLYQQIHQQRPDMLLTNNNEDTPEMDVVSNEQKTGMTPAYDYPQAVWTAQPRIVEADYKLPSSGAWWYSGSDSSVDYTLTLGRFVMNAGSSIKSLEDEQAMVNGKFPSKQVAFNNFADTYLGAIWESLGGTEGGGFLHGGMPGGFWNDGAHGATTISRSNPNLQYIHVVTRPSGSVLKVRDAGYHVTKVTDLRTGAARTFSQANGVLTINNSSWDSYDTVFKVETTAGRVGVYSGVKASASTGTAANLVDGDYAKYWSNNKTVPATVTLDLGSAKRVEYLGINQHEDSVSYERSSTEQSARIKGYSVAVSTNGSSWTTVKSGTLPSHRGAQFIDLNVASARYVRLTMNGTWATAGNSKNRIGIDELWVAGGYA